VTPVEALQFVKQAFRQRLLAPGQRYRGGVRDRISAWMSIVLCSRSEGALLRSVRYTDANVDGVVVFAAEHIAPS